VATKKPTSPKKELRTTKKPRRVLKAAPTLREQVEQNANPAKATKKSVASKVVSAPFRFVWFILTAVAKLIAASFIGKIAVAVWKSALFIPVRFIVRILAKVLLIDYFVKSFKELKLVTWPDTRTTIRLTFAVVMFAVTFGLIVAGMDYVFEKLFREVIL
jgi:preprotein translocase SecE subunit